MSNVSFRIHAAEYHDWFISVHAVIQGCEVHVGAAILPVPGIYKIGVFDLEQKLRSAVLEAHQSESGVVSKTDQAGVTLLSILQMRFPMI